jgi:hypothetical protein
MKKSIAETKWKEEEDVKAAEEKEAEEAKAAEDKAAEEAAAEEAKANEEAEEAKPEEDQKKTIENEEEAEPDDRVLKSRQTELADANDEIEEVGLTEKVQKALFDRWMKTETTYVKSMTSIFKKVRKQQGVISMGLEDMKQRFLDFTLRSDPKESKLKSFIESFNKFTEEFPELRTDDQTKEELMNRL